MLEIKNAVLIIFLFFPKISIIDVEGYSQGVRIEDLLILGIFLHTIIKSTIELNRHTERLLLIFLYLLIVSIVCYISGVDQQWLIFVRFIEYIIVTNYIFKCDYKKEFFKKILILFILINFLIAVPQHYGIVGGFSSSEYLPGGHGWLERSYGLMGGPWELGVVLVIALLSLDKLSVSVKIQAILYVMVAVCLMFADTRANIIAFIFCTIYKFRNYLNKNNIIIIFLLLYFTFYNIELKERYEVIVKMTYGIYDYILGNINLIDILIKDVGIYNRINIWIDNLEIWRSNLFYIIFGVGWHSLYMESLFLRMLFTFGLFGTVMITYLYRKCDKDLLLFIFLSGLTLDLFLSFKIFILCVLYSKVSAEIKASVKSNKENLI